jgi:hypothetical protein
MGRKCPRPRALPSTVKPIMITLYSVRTQDKDGGVEERRSMYILVV